MAGYSLDCDGDDDAQAADNAGFDPGAGNDLCVECFVYLDSAPDAFDAFIWKAAHFLLLVEGSSFPRFRLHDDVTGAIDLDDTGTLSTGSWVHLAGVFDNSADTAALFVNGSRAAVNTGVTGNISDDGSAAFILGSQGSGTGGTDGRFAGVRISNDRRYDPASTTLTVPTARFASDASTLALYLNGDGVGGSGTVVDNEEGTAALDLNFSASTNDPAWSTLGDEPWVAGGTGKSNPLRGPLMGSLSGGL